MTRKAAALLLLFICAAPAVAEPGLTAAPFLNAPMGARSAAMGQAFTAVAGGGESLNYNPGALAFSERFSVTASYMRGFGDVSHGFVAAPLTLGRLTLTPGFMYFDAGTMDLNLTGGITGTVDAETDTAVYASAAMRVGGRLGLGFTAKRVRLELAEAASASAMVYDFGAFYAAGRGFTLGASMMNTGGSFKFEQAGDPSPSVTRLGAAWSVDFTPPNPLGGASELVYCAALLTADWIAPRKDEDYYQVGAELDMDLSAGSTMALRTGYLFDRAAESLTFGLGLTEGRWSLDLAFAPGKAMNARQQATAGYRF